MATREPLVFTAAGLVLGFVLGYMVANAGGGKTAAAPEKGGRPTTAAVAAAKPPREIDPSEVRALTSLAEREKDNPAVRVELGHLYADHERCDDAVRWYGEALALVPNNAEVHVDLGACLVQLARYDEALREFEAALKLQPGHKKAVFNKGLALAQAGRTKEAIVVWEDLLKRHPDDPQLQVLRTQIERLRGQGRS